MTSEQLYYLITMEKKSSNTNTDSSFPLFGLVNFFFFHRFFIWVNSIKNLLSRFGSSLQSQLCFANPEIWDEKKNLELLSQPNCFDVKKDDGNFRTEEVEMVMGKLGIFCSPESEQLPNCLDSNELSRLFEEEPSLEEVKEAFDVFDQNRDGFVDAMELQRILRILGFKEGSEWENCKKMIKTFDENGDGRIDFNEFVKVMEKLF